MPPSRRPGGDRKVGLVVDEWGTWYDPEPGSRPGFLYQQNSLRDALVAALNFHVFHRHAGRVVMANIAQTVNVLQAMILMDKEKMLRTPSYWVFEMFKVHQGGTVLPVELQSPDYTFGQEKIPMVSASATRAADVSAIHVSLAYTSPTPPVTLSVWLAGLTPKSVGEKRNGVVVWIAVSMMIGVVRNSLNSEFGSGLCISRAIIHTLD